MAKTSLRDLFRSFFSLSPSPFSSPSISSMSNPPKTRLHDPNFIQPQTCKNMRELFQIQAHIITSGLFQDPFAASRVLKFSADLGDPDYAALVFRQIESPDTFSVNILIKAYSLGSDPGVAVGFYFDMRQKGFLPNSFTFPPLASACAKSASASDGEKCHGQAVKNGANEVLHVQNSLVHMYGSCGLIDNARTMFDEMPIRDLVSWNSIIDGYVKVGNLVSARKLFDEMPERNVVSWNVMIAGYLKGRNPGFGLKLFRQMRSLGLRGNVSTVVSVGTACGRSNRLKEGRSVHGFYARNFVENSMIFNSALVDMYSKCRRLDYARRVFNQISMKNLICWNAMILGYCLHGRPEEGLTLFQDMVGRGSKDNRDDNNYTPGVMPDEVTFVGILCACVRAGLMSEGQKYFDEMINVYNITPKFAHYWCMANLYCSCGFVQEAEEILRRMPEGSESLLWSGLLGSCRFRGDVELGEHIAKRLIELEPYNGSRYTLLSSVYAVAGRWEDVAKVREMMKERGVSVTPGSSLVDLNEFVHEFRVGDRSQPEIEKIYMMMDELAGRLKLSKCALEPAEFS